MGASASEFCVRPRVMFFTISSGGPIRASTILHFGLVLVERRFDSGFQSRSAKWLEHIPKGAGSHRMLHCLVIGMRGEKDNPAHGSCRG